MSNSFESPSSKRLNGKVAIITGGASGIGASTARLFARHGAKIVVADIQDDLGQSLCAEIGDAMFVHCNVTIESDVKALVDAAVERYGGLDIMFSNAGVSGEPELSALSATGENFRRVLDVNVVGAFLCAKHAARVMTTAGDSDGKKPSGTIVFTASMVSETSGEAPHAYTTSKHALVGLMKSLCVDFGQRGIRVNSVSPAPIYTPLLRDISGGFPAESVERVLEEAAVLTCHDLRVDDVAEAVLFLVGDEAKYVNGVNLVVDGGYSTTNQSITIAMRNLMSQSK